MNMAKSERNGNRRRRDSFQKRVPDLGYYFIATDTKATEENYLYGFRDTLPKELRGRIVIKVLKAKTNELVKVCKEQAAMEPQYGQPWILFDRDQVVNFDQIIDQAVRENIHVGWSNPCIEIWFDAYFGKMHNYQDSVICCREFANTFEKRSGQEYQKANRRIYQTLQSLGDEQTAILIARRRHQQYLRNGIEKASEMCPCTTVHCLIEEIRHKTSAETKK